MSPTTPLAVQLAPEVRETLGRSSAEAHQALTHGTKFLLALAAKAQRSGTPVFAGIDPAEKRRRRAKGKAQRAARRTQRGR